MSAIYDLLGFMPPVVLLAKIIFQDICRRKLKWKDPIPNNCLGSVNSWIEDLPPLGQFPLDRCYKSNNFVEIADVLMPGANA